MPTEDDLLTVNETAQMFRVHPTTIYRQLAAGTFPFRAIRIGHSWRVLSADVADFLNGGDDDDDA